MSLWLHRNMSWERITPIASDAMKAISPAHVMPAGSLLESIVRSVHPSHFKYLMELTCGTNVSNLLGPLVQRTSLAWGLFLVSKMCQIDGWPSVCLKRRCSFLRGLLWATVLCSMWTVWQPIQIRWTSFDDTREWIWLFVLTGTKKLDFKGKQWHEQCFLCDSCHTPLGTQSFVPKNENTNLCVPCYERDYADKCTKCGLVSIHLFPQCFSPLTMSFSQSIAGAGVSYKNENWHKECFTCANCNTGLAGQRFTIKDGKTLCAECYGIVYAKKCSGCTNPIIAAGENPFFRCMTFSHSFPFSYWIENDCFRAKNVASGMFHVCRMQRQSGQQGLRDWRPGHPVCRMCKTEIAIILHQ